MGEYLSPIMKENIKNLIQNLVWAGIDSITFGDGRMILLDIEFYSKEKYHISPIADSTIDSYLQYNLADLSPFDISARTVFNNYEVFAGDASGEGNGIVYVIDQTNDSLIWFAFFENSDPFRSVSVNDDAIAIVVTSENVTWKIPIKDPLKIELIWPN
jgi:hypothetical protein